MFRKPTTVDAVMSVFHKTMADLTTVAEINEAAVVSLEEEKATIDDAICLASEEAARARKVCASLVEIVQ